MNEIRDAILADQLDAVARAEGAGVLSRGARPQGRAGHVRGPRRPRRRTRASRCTSRRSPTPELGPGEAIVAVMASSVNYNTVWTSIFEPVSTFGFLERYGRLSELTKRHDLPYHVVGLRPGRRRPAGRSGREQVEARRRGRGALPVGRARGPGRPRRHDDGPAAAHLGLRDELRRPGRAGPGQEQPAHAQAGPPQLGGGGRPRAGELHRLPAAGQPQRRAT